MTTSWVATDRRLTRRQALWGLGTVGAWAVAPALVSTAACAQTSNGPTLLASEFPSLAEAVRRWSELGGTLVVDADYVTTSPITMYCVKGRSYRLTSDQPRTIAYAGPHHHWLFCIYSEGHNPFAIDGELTFDGRNRCNIPLFARFEKAEGSARRDFSVDGMVARNARMKLGFSTIDKVMTNAYGATGMRFQGGFDHLTLRRVRASGVSRQAGAGLAGSQGCAGIAVVGYLGSTRSAKHVLIEDFVISDVNSDDPPGSAARVDMDGLLVFQAAEASGTRPRIQRGEINEAAGRAVKVFAPGGGGSTCGLTIRRSVHGSTGGSNDLAHQHGDGLIEDIAFYYSGDAHSQQTIPLGFSSGTAREPGFPFAEGVVRNVRIHDTTGRDKEAIVTMYYSPAEGAPRRYIVEGLVDDGTARQLFMPGGLGSYGQAEIVLEDISVHLTRGLLATRDRSQHLRVVSRHFRNRNARSVPFKVFYDGKPAPPRHGGAWLPDETVRGVQG